MSEFKNGDRIKLLEQPQRHLTFVGDAVDEMRDGWCIAWDHDRDCTVQLQLMYLTKTREPVRVEGWVNLYENPSIMYVWESREQADSHATNIFSRRIACVHVTGIEEL